MLAWCWYYLFEYFRTFLFPQIKETFLEYKDKFLEDLWNRVKDDVHKHLQASIDFAQEYFSSAEYEAKERIVIDTIFKKVQLPLVLKPFKPLLKKITKDKVRKIIAENLKKLDQKI
jgi:uncharacterized protein (DUF2461 family)